MLDRSGGGVEASTVRRLLAGHATFGQLADATRDRLCRDSEVVVFAPGDALVRQGATSDAAYFIVSGEVEVSVETAYGPVALARLPPASLLGELGVFAELPRTATGTALTEVAALRIGRPLLLEIGSEHPQILLSVINQLSVHMNTINRTVGFYTHALAALERRDFDPAILDELMHPVPEMVNFAATFRRLAEQIVQRRTHREEMASAAAIQRSMLPPPWSRDAFGGGVDIHARMRPAREVGGDFFDYFQIDERRIAVVIADVCGKGVPASLFMAITRTVLRLVAREDRGISTGFARANDLLSAENDQALFVTLFYAEIDVETGAMTYCNCGHNPPRLVRPTGEWTELTHTGLPLAMMPGSVFETQAVTLGSGDRLVLYTDGVTEASDDSNAEFGIERLAAAIADHLDGSAEDLVAGIFQRVEDFAAGAPQSDDVTCLTLIYRSLN